METNKKAAKVSTVKQEKKGERSTKSTLIAEALLKHWPKEAEKIVSVMLEASKSRSMQRKLSRVQQTFASLRKESV